MVPEVWLTGGLHFDPYVHKLCLIEVFSAQLITEFLATLGMIVGFYYKHAM
jgi:hypothetical protein